MFPYSVPTQNARRLLVGLLICLFTFTLNTSSLQAQDKELATLKEALATWQAINQRIQVKDLVNKTSPDSARFMGGTVVLFGEETRMEVEFKKKSKKRLLRLMIDFPPSAKLTTDDFRAIFGKSFDQVMPPGFGTGLGIKKLEIGFEDKRKGRVNQAGIAMRFGSWMPFEGEEAISLTDLEAMFNLQGIHQGTPSLEVALGAYFFLPEDLAQKLNIGQTKLLVRGAVNTTTKELELSGLLNSREIPIDEDGNVNLQKAEVVFAFKKGKPTLALGGSILLKENGQPLMPALNGEISIDLGGTIYGEAWMEQSGEWANPFKLNPKLYINRMGFGFGANFNTVIPTPILAMEGGFTVKNSPTSTPRFKGHLTLGIDTGNPTRNMIDAEVEKVHVADLVDVFGKSGLPPAFANELRKIVFSNLHFTLVPPGPGVKLFDIDYQPGFYAEGAFTYGSQRGAMLLDISDDGVEGFAGLSPINHPGFSLTGTQPGQGPFLYLALKPAEQTSALAINGKVEVMGVSALTDIYLSDAGFNLTMEGKIFDDFQVKLDVAGKDLIGGDGLYVKASMRDDANLLQKITREASAEIDALADDVAASYNTATKTLEAKRPQLEQAKRDLTAKQEIIRKRWKKWCSLMNQREAQNKEKVQKEAAIRKLATEINQLEAKLTQDRFRPAKALNATSCGGNSKRAGDYCYSPAAGWKWDIVQPVNGSKATFKPESRDYKAAIVRGTYTIFGGCPGGQFGDAATGKCYSCPAGYKKDGLNTRCVKVTPVQYQPAVRGQYVGCGRGRSFADISTGKCWECPSGYERKITTHSITSGKACELINLGQREAVIRNKRLEHGALVTSLELITKGIGELATQLSGVSSNICSKVSDTDAINADPEVAPLFAKWSGLSLTVVELQKTIKFIGDTQVGGLRAAAWMTRHGGEALGIVDIDYASFEGCLSTVKGGSVSLSVKGKFADQPLNASFKLNLQSPEQGIKAFAKLLMGDPNPTVPNINGTCTKPNVPRPNISGTKIAELMEFVNGNQRAKMPTRPKKEERPAWAGERRFDGERFARGGN